MPDENNQKSAAHRQRLFKELVDEHYLGLWNYVRALTRQSVESEDITHQAFLVAFDNLLKEKPINNPATWLKGVARNLVREWWRKNKQLPAELIEEHCRLADETDDQIEKERNEREHALESCIQKLSRDEQELIKSRYQEGIRVTQLANTLDTNVETTRVRLFRIRKKLKACVEKAFSGRLSR